MTTIYHASGDVFFLFLSFHSISVFTLPIISTISSGTLMNKQCNTLSLSRHTVRDTFLPSRVPFTFLLLPPLMRVAVSLSLQLTLEHILSIDGRGLENVHYAGHIARCGCNCHRIWLISPLSWVSSSYRNHRQQEELCFSCYLELAATLTPFKCASIFCSYSSSFLQPVFRRIVYCHSLEIYLCI